MLVVIVLVVVLAVLALVADRVGARMAATRIEDELVASGFERPVEVEVGGFPFLTQLLAERLEEVTVDARTFPLRSPEGEDGEQAGEPLPLRDVHAVLTGVRDGGDVVLAETVRMRGVLEFIEIEQRLPREGTELTLSPAPAGDGVHIEATVQVFGQELRLTGTAQVSVGEESTLVITPAQVDAPEGAGSVETGGLQDSLTLSVPVSGIPQGSRLDDVEVVQDGFQLHIVGEDVRLPRR